MTEAQMGWGVGAPRQVEGGDNWEVALVDQGGSDRLVLRFTSAAEAIKAANDLRSVLSAAIDVRAAEDETH